DATRAEQPGQRGDQVDNKNGQIAHRRIVAGWEILRNHERNNNSPGTAPRIAINDLLTDSQRSEQSGFANLVKGFFGMFRNPTAHEARVLWRMSKEDAEDLLSIASLIHRRIDAARSDASVVEPYCRKCPACAQHNTWAEKFDIMRQRHET